MNTVNTESIYDKHKVLKSLVPKEDRARFYSYREFLEWYEGEHWEDAEKEDGNTPTPVWNKIKSCLDKVMTHMFGKGVVIEYPSDTIQSILSPIYDKIIKESGGSTFINYIGKHLAVTGNCYLKPVFEIGKNVPKIQIIESDRVIVEHSPADTTGIPRKALIITDNTSYLPDTTKIVGTIKVEEITPALITDHIFEFSFSNTPSYSVESRENVLGKVYLVHIENELPIGDSYGISDVKDVIELNKSLNATLRQVRDILAYNGDPTTLVFGADSKVIRSGQGSLPAYSLPKDAKVELLELQGSVQNQLDFIGVLENSIAEATNVPVETLRGNKPITHTSGSALNQLFSAIAEKIERKQLSCKRGLETTLKFALDSMVKLEQIGNAYTSGWSNIMSVTKIKDAVLKELREDPENNLALALREWNDIDVKFKGFIQKERAQLLSELSDEIRLGLESRKGAMRMLGKKNPTQILEEISKDHEELQLLDAKGSFEKVDKKTGVKRPKKTNSDNELQ